MEGLEIKEKDFSAAIDNKDFRIDSQFYTKEPIKNPVLKYDKIGNHLIKAQYGISISMNEDDIGYPIYRMNEIHNMMCDSNVSKYADITKTELNTFVLNDRDVVFNRTNSFEWVGRTGLYKKEDLRDFVFASYLVRFIPNQDFLLPEYLTTFLNTKYGIWDIKRRARQSINQTNVNPEEVKEIEFPLLSINFQKLLKCCFDNAHEVNILSQAKYKQAENILLGTLGLKDFEPSKEPVNIKSFNESFGISGRLDAEYYQPKYEQVVERIKSTNYDTLSSLVKIKKSIEPGSDAYSDKGLPFIRVSDYNKFGLSEPDKKLSDSFCKENETKLNKLKPKKETILFSKDGSVGTAYMLRNNANFVTSGAILHLTVRDKKHILPEYLALALNSKLVQMQAERDAGGSIILHWRIGEIENVVVPVIDFSIQEVIAELVEESFTLKKQSEQLLDLAKTAVEKAIEENEEKATNYINSTLTELKITIDHE